MCGAHKRLPAFGARTFATVITTSVVQDLKEKIAGVDYPLRCTYRSRAVFSLYLIELRILCRVSYAADSLGENSP
jgi:hypothetical protein